MFMSVKTDASRIWVKNLFPWRYVADVGIGHRFGVIRRAGLRQRSQQITTAYASTLFGLNLCYCSNYMLKS